MKQIYHFFQIQIMTTKPENMFSFYDSHNINCQTFQSLFDFLLEEREKNRTKLYSRLKCYFSLKKKSSVVKIHIKTVTVGGSLQKQWDTAEQRLEILLGTEIS